MTKNNKLNNQEELFARDCKLINLKYEYDGYTGTEKWAVITELTEEELWDKYPDIISRYTPFVLLSMAQGKVIIDDNRETHRCEMRDARHLDAFADLYLPMWGNALCADRKELDVLGVGAYDGEKLVGLAACSADCDNMWQIGVDVLPEYRRMGIASSLTSNLAIEIIERGKVPFYCCAWSNLKSVKNALRSGFVPGWVEMTVKAASLVDEMNK